ncbi:hypothetical protein C942_02759 [Photobacterium marinum]|uniref:Uncharacterized protein n=1 Tax=Photobacterium marinum TaxID=1056511 RepID=L8JEL1_9GAMM|nr:hypothetical protein [Photobacterium marinum]ELR67250.1 hypothetical protein C942_02759 [Photobacterium marinum]
MTVSTKINEIESIAASLSSDSTLKKVLTELSGMYRRGDFRLSFSLTNGTANTMPLYSADDRKLVGAHVSFRDDLPNLIHEMTHARVLECYRSDLVNYYCPDNNPIALEFGKGSVPGAPIDTVSLIDTSLNNRRRARYRTNCKTTLEGNLNWLARVAESVDYSETNHKFMSAENKRLLKMPMQTEEDMKRHCSLNAMMMASGFVQKSRKFMKANRINADRLGQEQGRKKSWIKERINYGMNGMGGLGDVHFEYDTVVNQMLLQMHLWGYEESHELFAAIGKLAQEAHERRESAFNSTLPSIKEPRSVIASL